MTVQTVPFALQGASHSAALFRQAVSNPWQTAGVMAAGELAVGAQGTPNMSVQVGAGRAKVNGSLISPPTLLSGSTGNFTSQAMYDVFNDGPVSLTISTADPTNPRIDTVYISVQDAYYSGSNNQAVLGVVAGTPAPSPTAPPAPSNSLVLGQIAVAANATSIVAGNITNTVSQAALNNVPGVPFAIASGSGSNSAGSYTTVNFPVGRFTVPPQLIGSTHGANVETVNFGTVTSTSAQIAGFAGSSAVASSWYWVAIQMTPTSAAG